MFVSYCLTWCVIVMLIVGHPSLSVYMLSALLHSRIAYECLTSHVTIVRVCYPLNAVACNILKSHIELYVIEVLRVYA
jgi:hypothetical protein